MQRVLILAMVCFSVVLTAGACSRDRERDVTMARDASDKDQIEVTGCLTANATTNQFVLTANSTALTSLANRAGAGEAETHHYQLEGGNNLQQYVGKEVVVKGVRTGRGTDVNIESKEKTEGTPTKSRGDEVTPAIQSKEEVELQVERLNIASITPTGAACQIGQESGQRR
jgi:hypothetical protein